MINKDIVNSAIILATITAVLYVHGLTFYQGFLRYWGIEESLFPITFERTLFQGYIAYLYLGASALLPALFAFFIIFCSTLGINQVVKLSIKHKYPRFLYKKCTDKIIKEYERQPLHDVLVYSGIGMLASYILIIVFVIIFGLSYLSDKQGFSAAENQHKKFDTKDHKDRFSSKVQFSGKTKSAIPEEGNIIVCSNSHCAIYYNNKVSINKITDIDSITSLFSK